MVECSSLFLAVSAGRQADNLDKSPVCHYSVRSHTHTCEHLRPVHSSPASHACFGVWKEAGEHGQNPSSRRKNMRTERPRARNPICTRVTERRQRCVKTLLKSINVLLLRSAPFFSLKISSFFALFLLCLRGDSKRVRVLCFLCMASASLVIFYQCGIFAAMCARLPVQMMHIFRNAVIFQTLDSSFSSVNHPAHHTEQKL